MENPLAMKLSDLPLWRLIVALDDAEKAAGPNSGTARVLAREIKARLQTLPPDTQKKGSRRE